MAPGNTSRLVKKVRFGERIKLDFTDTNVKSATIHIEKNIGYSEGWLKLIIEADRGVPITSESTR